MLLLPSGAFVQSTLTLERAVQLSQQQSRQFPAQAAQAEATRQMAVAAGQSPDFTLKLGINNLPVTGSDAFNLTCPPTNRTSLNCKKSFTMENDGHGIQPRHLLGAIGEL